MKNTRMFVVKFISNNNGTRFRITDTRHRGQSKLYSWNYEQNGLTSQASDIFKKRKIKISGYSEPWNEDNKVYFFSNDFKTQLMEDK